MPSSVSSTHGVKTPPWFWYLLGAVLLIVLAGVAKDNWPAGTSDRDSDAEFKNVLVVTFDTTRADHIGAYGHREAVTPNLNRMAQEGALFERCITVAPITLPSHTSILTGLYPNRHGARNNGTHHVPEDITTMAEVLREEGFATGAVVSALVLDSRYGLDQGFDSYDDNLANAEKAPLFMFRETKADETARRAIRWIKDRAGERWFMWVHFFDPHANYAAPEEFARLCKEPYDGEIAFADAGLGTILETLRLRGELDNTLVVMTSDHGDSLGEHGESTHGMFVYEATTWVPLIMRHPGLVQGKRVAGTVSSVDIMPTCLDLLDVDVPRGIDGVSMAKVLLSKKGRAERPPVYQEAMNPYYNHGWSDLRAARDDSFRYIRAPRPELYDMFRDRRETRNLLPGAESSAEPYIDFLGDLLTSADRDSKGDDILSMDPEMREALAQLGYVWSEEEEMPAEGETLSDPKDMVSMWERSQLAHGLVRAKQYAAAEVELRKVLAEEPQSVLSRSALASVLIQMERRPEALDILRETVLMKGARNATWLRLAGLERNMEIEGWEARVETAKGLEPRDPMPWIREGDWAQEDEKPDAALAAYRAAIELDERAAKAWIGIGNTEHRRGNEAEAEAALLKAIEYDPIAFEAWYNLGVVAEALERPQDAEKFYLKAKELEDKHVLTLVNLGNLYMAHNRFDLAEEHYQAAIDANRERYIISHQLDTTDGMPAIPADEEDFKAWFNMGLLRSAQGDPQRASEAFEIACRSEPAEMVAWMQLMRVCRKTGANERALEAAEVLLGLTPNNIGVLLHAGIAAHRLGSEDVAIGYVERARAVNAARVEKIAGVDRELGEWLGVEPAQAPQPAPNEVADEPATDE